MPFDELDNPAAHFIPVAVGALTSATTPAGYHLPERHALNQSGLEGPPKCLRGFSHVDS